MHSSSSYFCFISPFSFVYFLFNTSLNIVFIAFKFLPVFLIKILLLLNNYSLIFLNPIVYIILTVMLPYTNS